MKNRFIIDWDEYAKTARLAAAEGAVLLENKDGVLPMKKGDRISIFGRSQLNYYKSGTGSGGLVNTKYVVSILDALLKEDDLVVDKDLLDIYRSWIIDHPFDVGNGWAMEPWSQEEMPLTDEIVNNAKAVSDKAVVIIGRTAGEDKDAKNEKGSYLLTDEEELMLEKVTKAFDKTIVLLNVGSILDMSWMDKYNPSAVLYLWQGGMEGGNSACDVLMGRENPSGCLPDTIAYSIDDYPSTLYFGGDEDNKYAEDIYVGYRYFETFARDRVRYPFGYGLSYTSFEAVASEIEYDGKKLMAKMTVKNTGKCAGKYALQVYIKAPQGKLGKSVRTLVAYKKTKLLEPSEEELLEFEIADELFASYDDSGATGYRFSYVLESGKYDVYAGDDVRAAAKIGSFNIDRDVVVKTCKSAAAPVKSFDRMRPKPLGGGCFTVEMEEVPLRTYDPNLRRSHEVTSEYEYTGDFGYKLSDVYDRHISMGTFLSQLSDVDLRCLVRGEGMCSRRVTPGTAAAFGGVSERLEHFGIPAGCCSDGPSGIRMDCGTYAVAMPNGTCLAATFNDHLNEKLYEFEGAELRKNRIDTLLGPGMNIHRNPLNGRNFEYFSEDPLLTGRIAAAQLRGMHKYGVTGTIKHFAANNQEHNRRLLDSVISERALREIYLKGFEIAVKEGKAYSLMTSYGAVNGVWSASNYDLNTTLLKEEWGFEGMVMTDWWAAMNSEGTESSTHKLKEMVLAGNDVYMVTKDAMENEEKDNLKEAMEAGELTRGQLEKSAVAILRMLMQSPVMDRYLDRLSEEEKEAIASLDEEDQDVMNLEYLKMDEVLELDGTGIDTSRGKTTLIGIESSHIGKYEVKLTLEIDALEMAQVPVTFYANGIMHGTQSLRPTNGQTIEVVQEIGIFGNRYNVVKLFYGQGGIKLKKITISLAEELTGTIWEG